MGVGHTPPRSSYEHQCLNCRGFMSSGLVSALCCPGSSNGGWPWFPCRCFPPLEPPDPSLCSQLGAWSGAEYELMAQLHSSAAPGLRLQGVFFSLSQRIIQGFTLLLHHADEARTSDTFRSDPSVRDLHADEAADHRWCLHDGAGFTPDVGLQGKAAKLGAGLAHC